MGLVVVGVCRVLPRWGSARRQEPFSANKTKPAKQKMLRWEATAFGQLLLSQPVHPKGDQSCVFIGSTDAEAGTSIVWPPDAKSWLVGKDPDAGKDWGQQETGTTEDEMVGWHHRLNGHEFEWTPGVGDGQGDLACCGSWGRKESDTTERLNWTERGSIGWLGKNLTVSGFLSVLAVQEGRNENSNSQLLGEFVDKMLPSFQESASFSVAND